MPKPFKIFISYSHQDAEYLGKDSLLGFLKGLENEGVEFWDDRNIRAGELWDDVIKAELAAARITLVLVSQAFLDSKYCQKIEIETLLAHKAHLIPMILSPCDWRRHEWLAKRQFMPSGDKTIEEHYTDSGSRKRLFLEIREALRHKIAEIEAQNNPPSPTPQASLNSGQKRLEFCRRLGNNWRDLTIILDIPSYECKHFAQGDEARQILEWLDNHGRTTDLPMALIEINRKDLADLFKE
jgi:hypothetical protein